MIPTPFTRTAWVSPLERLYSLHRELDRTFESAESQNGGGMWVPPMDVVETTDELLCHVEVPGLTPDDLEIRVQDNMLVLAGEKKFNGEQQEGGFRSVERRYGRFERTITLPRTVDTNAVKARHENGVLTVVLPKVEASKPRRIEIEGSNSARALNQ
jgi:HSP20 family protein